MTAKTLNANTMRWVLTVSIFLLVAGGAVGSNYLQTILNEKMSATNKVKFDATNSNQNLAKAQALGVYLKNNAADIEKTALIVGDTTAYRYQDQIVQDITKYAQLAGVTILGFDFPTAPTAAKPSATGLKSITATITLQNPVSYRSYLTFLKFIESNLTKMQVTDISITPDSKDPNLINNPVIGLEVYVK